VEVSLFGDIYMEQIEDIRIRWDKRKGLQGELSRVIIDGKELPVAKVQVDIGPHGKDFVTLTLHAFRVAFEVED
jgi:hypothetical protein